MADPFNLKLGDALIANSFGVSIDNAGEFMVKEVSGLKQEFDMIEVKSQTGDGKYILRKIPGRPKPVTVTITRALTEDKMFVDWMSQIELGITTRKDVVVKVFHPGDSKKAVKTFTIKDCQPSAIEITTPQAGGTAALEEKITLMGVTMMTT